MQPVPDVAKETDRFKARRNVRLCPEAIERIRAERTERILIAVLQFDSPVRALAVSRINAPHRLDEPPTFYFEIYVPLAVSNPLIPLSSFDTAHKEVPVTIILSLPLQNILLFRGFSSSLLVFHICF